MNRLSKDSPWSPNMDMFVDGSGDLVIEFDISHLQREDIEILAESHSITISGSRKALENANNGYYLEQQIPRGAFAKQVDVPEDYDISEGKAAYKNGILRITVPKTKYT